MFKRSTNRIMTFNARSARRGRLYAIINQAMKYKIGVFSIQEHRFKCRSELDLGGGKDNFNFSASEICKMCADKESWGVLY